MKRILMIFSILCILSGCSTKKCNQPKLSVYHEEKSIINQWYGAGHFDSTLGSVNDSFSKTNPYQPTQITPGGAIYDMESSDLSAPKCNCQKGGFFAETLFQFQTSPIEIEIQNLETPPLIEF